mgnify:CR=1 FL=1
MSLFPIVAADESAAENVALPAFLVARDGLYLRKRSLLGLSQVQVDGVAHLPPAREYLEYGLPKVPASLMGQVVGFFRAIWARQKTEALALLTWDGSAFGLIVPEQRAGVASVRHRVTATQIPTGVTLVGSIHSHGALGAGASLTDEADEADFDGIHVVVGDVDERRPSYSAAIVVDGRRFGCRTSLVLGRPRRFPSPPVEWLLRVKQLEARRPTSTGNRRARSEEVSTPTWADEPTWTWHDRAMLDDILADAVKVAARMGESLVYSLTPIARPAKGGAPDA